MDLWFRPVDPTLPVPWTSVTDDSSGMVFYWNPETNVSQYEYPNPPPPPPPPPDHYRFPFKYTPTFPSSALTYRPPDYPASYMPELPVAPVYTSPIFLPHPAPPSVVFSASIDVPQIPHSYTTNPNFQDPQIYSPPSYKQNSWVFDSENRLRFNDPHQVSPYEIDLGPDLNVHTAPTAGNVFSKVRGVRHTSPKMSLKSVRAKHKLAVCSHVRMKRKAPSVSFCQRRQRNQVLPSFSAAPSLSLAPLPQAHEQTFPTNREQHLLNTNHSAGPERLLSLKPIGSGAPKHLVDSEDVEGVNPNPQVELGHVLVVGDSCCHESLARTVFLLPGAEVDAERELFDALLHANIVDSDLGVGHTATEAGFRVGFVLDICYSDVTAEQGQGYQQFQFDVLSLVGNQPWVPHAIQMFDGMPKRRIKDPMPNFLTLDLMEQFKSGLALNEYTSCALRALRAIRMLRFLFDEGGDLRELQIVEAVFRQLCQLTETSIKIVSDQLSIVDITLLYPVSLELTLLALDWSNLHITRPLILILTAVFLPFEDFSIICRHFQTVSSKENMVYHFKVSYTVNVRLMPLMTHTHFLPYEDIILALTYAYWSSEAMHLRKFIATSFHKSGLLNNDFALIVLHLHLKPVEKFMEIFENVWISWMTLLISMNHKGALNMESLIKLQRLLPMQSRVMNLLSCGSSRVMEHPQLGSDLFAWS